MADLDQEALASLQRTLDRIEEAMKPEARARLVRQVLVWPFWYGLPFFLLWSFGIDPLVAARVAVFPWLCVVLGSSFLTLSLFIGGSFMVASMKLVTK